MRTIHDLIQGSDPWLQFRYNHDGASEAAAMLSLSKLTTRTELLRMKKTGITKEFSDWVQRNVLDHGHHVEALARPLVNAIIGQDLYASTCSIGRLSASCDGLTMDELIAFEHKQWNEALAALVRDGVVPDEHMPQCQQVLMVTKAEKLLFVVSNGTPEKFVYCEVFPDTAWFDRIESGWAQFHRDLADFVPVDAPAVPMGKSMEALPALLVQVRGEVTASNLNEFKEYAVAVITSINRELNTDQDFADASKAIKWCLDVKEKMVAVKAHTLAQTQSIEQVFMTIDSIVETADEVRSELNGLVTRRNKEKKDGMVIAGQQAFTLHLTGLEHELRPLRLSAVAMPNFAESIKGKRSYVLMQDAVDSLLASAKIAADAMARDYRAKQAWLATAAAGHLNLFADLQQLVAKPMDDFQLVVTSRVDAQKAKDQKIKDDAAEKALADKKVADDAAALATQHAAAVTTPVSEPKEALAPITRAESAIESVAVAPAVANVVQLRVTPAPVTPTASSTPPTLTLGQIGARLGFSLPAAFLESLGFKGTKERAAFLFHEADFPLICAALTEHIESVQAKQAA